MASNFQKVVDFNTQFGVLESPVLTPKTDIIENDPKQVEFCLKLIREEMGELEQAVKDKNYIEMIDALSDLLYVIYGAGCRIGMDMDKAFSLVHENNMTKLCTSEEEAIKTVQYYIDNKETLGYDSPTYRKAPNNIHYVVYNESTKKILKSINWKSVNLSVMVRVDLSV